MSHRRWDVFCAVVDNYGDMGVCWRLARQLVQQHGQTVRLWVDQPDALRAFLHLAPPTQPPQHAAPQAVSLWPCLHQGVQLGSWDDAVAGLADGVADVVIEAFACRVPEPYLLAMSVRQPTPLWINLEYLSAEPWVEGLHGLPSRHPRLPLTQYFFFPGFRPGSGGLLREAGLPNPASTPAPATRHATLRALGIDLPEPSPQQPPALLVSLFCYPHAPWAALFDAWASSPTPIQVLLPESLHHTLSASPNYPVGVALAPGHATGTQARQHGALSLHPYPWLDQDGFDQLLASCDINFVRGEDSLVRAIWAQRPLVWHIYPQQDAAHLAKLDALLELTWPDPVQRAPMAALWHAWNGDGADIDTHWQALLATRHKHQTEAEHWASQLAEQADLVENLLQFCKNQLK